MRHRDRHQCPNTGRHMAVAALALAALTGCAQPDTDRDRTAIEGVLRQWPVDFEEQNLDEVCGLFADHTVLIYPDSPDRTHDEFCAQMQRLFDDPSKTFEYAEPDIKEILVDGDLATVRLIWTLTVRDDAGRALETVREDGVDVLRRQADGTWKIHISHAFPLD